MTGVALVTGAGKRIGRQIALELADAGYDIAVHFGKSEAEAEEISGLIKVKKRRAALVQGDLTDLASVEKIVPAANKALGPLSVLINCASLFENDEVGGIKPESWQRHLDINLRAPVFLAQAFAQQLPADINGNIINLIDQRVLRLNPLFFSYTIAKSGLWTATRTLAQALAPRIRVNAIGPGPALPSSRMDDAGFARQAGLMPLKHGTSPSEIAAAVKFLLSQPAITGQMLALDGGQHLIWQTPDVTGVKE